MGLCPSRLGWSIILGTLSDNYRTSRGFKVILHIICAWGGGQLIWNPNWFFSFQTCIQTYDFSQSVPISWVYSIVLYKNSIHVLFRLAFVFEITTVPLETHGFKRLVLIRVDNKHVTDDVSFVRRLGSGVGSFNHSALPSPPRYPAPNDTAYPNTTTGAMAAPSMESHNNALVSRPPGPEYQLPVGEGLSPHTFPPPPTSFLTACIGLIPKTWSHISQRTNFGAIETRYLCSSRRNPPRHTITAPFRDAHHQSKPSGHNTSSSDSRCETLLVHCQPTPSTTPAIQTQCFWQHQSWSQYL